MTSSRAEQTPSHPLFIAVAQPETAHDDRWLNAHEHARCIREAAADVVVFPELSLTGYDLSTAPVSLDDQNLSVICEACAEHNSVALVGAPVANEDGSASIATLIIDGYGTDVAYRKMYLGTAETEGFEHGDSPSVLTVSGWRIGLGICRDTGIDEQVNDTVDLGIDIYAAGLVETQSNSAVIADRAARIAAIHGVWVAFASAAGNAGSGYDPAAGGSGIWSPAAKLTVGAGETIGEVARTTLTPQSVPLRQNR